MVNELDQLRYTWAPRGVEGANRFQIAAISPGLLRGPSAVALGAARKICRYDPPRGGHDPRPISFGWFDHRGFRVAFSRVALDVSQGRVGNFAAHVLIGSPVAMPEHELALRFRSPFWWTGGSPDDQEFDANLELPRVELKEIPPGPRDGEDGEDGADGLALALIHLAPQSRLAVKGDSLAIGRRLQQIGRLYPHALVGVSVSTYERTPWFPFMVTGLPQPPPGYPVCELDPPPPIDSIDAATLARLRDQGTGGSWLRAAATGAAQRTLPSERQRAVFWETATAIVAASNPAQRDAASLMAALTHPHAVPYLMSTPKGIERLADAVHTAAPGVISAIRVNRHLVAARDADALIELLRRRYLSRRNLRGCANAATLLPSPDGARERSFLGPVFQLAVEDEQAAATLDPNDIVGLIEFAGRSRIPVEAAMPLLRRAVGRIGLLARDESIPDSYVAALFVDSLSNPGPDDSADLVDALAARPSMLGNARLTSQAGLRLAEIVHKLRGRTLERALKTTLVTLAQTTDARSLERTLGLLPLPVAARTVAVATVTSNEHPSVTLSRLCDTHAALLLHEELQATDVDAHGYVDLALALLTASRSDDHPRAFELLNSLRTQNRTPPLRLAAEADLVNDASLARGLRSLAVDAAVARIQYLADITDIWCFVSHAQPLHKDPDRLGRLLHHITRQPPSARDKLALTWIATELFPRHPALLTASGATTHPDLRVQLVELAGRVHPADLDELGRLVELADRKTRRWWRGLDKAIAGMARQSTPPSRQGRPWTEPT